MPHDAHANHTDTGIGWVFVFITLLVLGAYLVAAYRQRDKPHPWSLMRTLLFACGALLLAGAFSPPMSDLAHSDLRGHMVQHLVIGMFAPIGLALGAPVTLLLRSVPTAVGRRVSALLRSCPSHVMSHPITAMSLNIGGMYILYLTPLFAASMSNAALHGLVNLHFLAAGYLFTWSIAGPDPAPGRPGLGTRLAVLVVSIAAHAYLGKAMYAHLWPRGTGISDESVRAAAELMYYGGDIAEFLLAIALFATWYQQRRRNRLRALERTGTQNSERRLAPAVNTP